MSLAADEGEGEQIELRTLQAQLEKTQTLVANLSQQLMELRDQVWGHDLWQTYNIRFFFITNQTH
jgi:hypothetical protein